VIAWRRNLFAVTAVGFIGFTGFTLVMPFLPLYFRQLGVADVGDIALWSGVSLGVTPAVNALVSPFWGRLADRFGRKIMVVRSLAACALTMGAMAFVTQPWHVFGLRAVLGLLTGYGGLTLTMAAESAPPESVPVAIGTVQTAQRLGPAVGPVIGGALAGLLGLRSAFVVTGALYAAALVLVLALYDERATHVPQKAAAEAGRVSFRSVLAFQNFLLLMFVVFSIQFVDRSFGPILPLFVEQLGVGPARVPVVAGTLFSIAAVAGALGHHFCARLLGRLSPRVVITAGSAAACAGTTAIAVADTVWVLGGATMVFGGGIGVAITAAYSAAASLIPAGVHGTGFGVLTSASLVGMAVSPVLAGLLGSASIRSVFIVDATAMAILALLVYKRMIEG
jgi:DHA1 family multidrug resistance protein-like MFS transporter